MKIKNHYKELKFLSEFMEFSAKEIFKDKELCNIILTLKPQKGSYGYCTRQEVYKDNELQYLEISYNIDYLDRGLNAIFDTLIHEQIHAYCRKANIVEVAPSGKYHNGKFKAICEEIGLAVEKQGGAGWNTIGKLSDSLEALIKEKFLSNYDPDYIDELFNIKNIHKVGTTTRKGRDRNYKKYVCPFCGQTVRAKAGANIICGDCNEYMEAK